MTSLTPKRRGPRADPAQTAHLSDGSGAGPLAWGQGKEPEPWPKKAREKGSREDGAPVRLADLSTEDSDSEPEAGEDGDEGGDPDDATDPAQGGDPKRRGRRRSKTIARKQMLRERRRMLAQGTIPEIVDYERPISRSECRAEKRPCLYVSCRYHLYLDVNPVTGSIKLNFPDKEVWDLEETCALDVAERGGITLEEVGEIMNLTRERIRQVEVSGLEKLKHGEADLHTFIDGRELEVGPRVGSKRLPVIDD